MRFPPRLGHLATRPVLAAKLIHTYAAAHRVDEEEAATRLEAALRGRLWEDLLEATWLALSGKSRRLTEEGLLEKVAQALKERPFRRSKAAALSPAWSALLVLLDLEAGTASESARKVLASAAGQAQVRAGMAEAGRFLADELTRG